MISRQSPFPNYLFLFIWSSSFEVWYTLYELFAIVLSFQQWNITVSADSEQLETCWFDAYVHSKLNNPFLTFFLKLGSTTYVFFFHSQLLFWGLLSMFNVSLLQIHLYLGVFGQSYINTDTTMRHRVNLTIARLCK